MDLELVEKLPVAFQVEDFIDVVVSRLFVKLDKVEDVDADGFVKISVGFSLLKLLAIEAAPVEEGAFGEGVFLQHLHFDVVPGAILALGLNIQHALFIFEVLFFVVGVFDHQIRHLIFFGDDGVDQIYEDFLTVFRSEELFKDKIYPGVHFTHATLLLQFGSSSRWIIPRGEGGAQLPLRHHDFQKPPGLPLEEALEKSYTYRNGKKGGESHHRRTGIPKNRRPHSGTP